MSRRTCLNNAIVTANNNNTLCLTETWVTTDVTSKTLFLSIFELYRKDREAISYISKHGGKLIAIEKPIKHQVVIVPLTLLDNIFEQFFKHAATLRNFALMRCRIFCHRG